MGMLIDGQWSDQDHRRTNANGEFVRTESPFRDHVGAGDNQFAAESGRYHLFINAGCPWAYRTLLYRALKNLVDVVLMDINLPGMTGIAAPKPCRAVQHLFSGRRCEMHILRALQQTRVGLEMTVGRERHPERFKVVWGYF